MQFSVITPSFRQSSWLRLCVASVADQRANLEHLVQDGGSDDGTLDWLLRDTRIKGVSEPDAGMYDAINRGLSRATGDIVSYLNCDEQYLPGTLDRVESFFQSHPDVQVAFGDAVVVDGDGAYQCSRPALVPTRYHSQLSGTLSILTCATFFRRRMLEDGRLLFDPSFRALGDADWICRLVDRGIAMRSMGFLASAFTLTGSNLSLSSQARDELRRLSAQAPWPARTAKILFSLQYRLRKLIAGHYSPKPFSYAIYTLGNPGARSVFTVSHPTATWKSRS